MTKRDEISDEELNALTSAIKRRYGLDFTQYEIKSLKRGFARLMTRHKVESLLDLWSQILKDRQFIYSCIDDLTVNLTELFRNPEFWKHMVQEVLPSFGSKPLDVWHAGCSTGEEVYSMSISATIAGAPAPRQLATDLSGKALQQASKGEFSSHLIRKYSSNFEMCFPHESFTKYFESLGDRVQVKPDSSRKVTFNQHNLVQDEMPGKFDIIFCRNVMIYFDDALKMKVLENLQKCLKPGGLFVLGYYDVMPNGADKLFQVYHPPCRIYKSNQEWTQTKPRTPLYNLRQS